MLFGMLEIGKKQGPATSLELRDRSARKASAADKSVRVVEYEPVADKRLIINSSANRSLYPAQETSPVKSEKGVLEISLPNTTVGRPFLHFFETSSQRLHLLSLEQLEKELIEWRTVNLKIDFDIPAFHKSILLRSGTILLIGGSWPDRKLSKIFQYDPSGERLKEIENMMVPRSSHAVTSIG